DGIPVRPRVTASHERDGPEATADDRSRRSIRPVSQTNRKLTDLLAALGDRRSVLLVFPVENAGYGPRRNARPRGKLFQGNRLRMTRHLRHCIRRHKSSQFGRRAGEAALVARHLLSLFENAFICKGNPNRYSVATGK